MNKTYYTKECPRLLNDKNFYIETKNDLAPEHANIIQTKIESLLKKGKITEEIYKCLKTSKHKTPSLYLLPKIHKIKKLEVFLLAEK